MTAENSNLEVIRSMYDAFGRESFQAPFAPVWKLASGKVTRFVQYADTVLVHQALER